MIDNNALIYPMVNQLFEEDCLECMKRIPNESIDMILCNRPITRYIEKGSKVLSTLEPFSIYILF